MVMCTHLHVDHIGWNTRLDNGRWVPTFPNARYVFGRTDYDHFLPSTASGKRPGQPRLVPRQRAAGGGSRPRRRSSTHDHALDEHLTVDTGARPHARPRVIELASQDSAAVFSGDAIHHAMQLYHPTWNSFACLDRRVHGALAAQMLRNCAGSGALLPPHISVRPSCATSMRTATPSSRASCRGAVTRHISRSLAM